MTDQIPASAMMLVPVEPTEAMVTAAIVAFNNGLSPRNILHAGIAAAPPAPAGRAEVERLREALRLYCLSRPPITEDRDTFADGFTNGILQALNIIDAALKEPS